MFGSASFLDLFCEPLQCLLYIYICFYVLHEFKKSTIMAGKAGLLISSAMDPVGKNFSPRQNLLFGSTPQAGCNRGKWEVLGWDSLQMYGVSAGDNCILGGGDNLK